MCVDNKEMLSRVFLGICEQGTLDIIQLLLNSGHIDCNFPNDINNKCSLHELAIAGRLDVLELCAKVFKCLI